MKIATWNINGVKARIDALTTWLKEAGPDVVCLQEIKSVDEGFPLDAVAAAGYQAAVHGQKGFNGVAILAKRPIEDVQRGLPGDPEDAQARYIEATLSGDHGRAVRVAGLYLPNGNPIGTEKFTYKLAWMERLSRRAKDLLALEMPVVLAGDFNVIPEPKDARNPANWASDALFQPGSRAALRALVAQGWTDAVRATMPGADVYTFWDYQAGAWPRNNGIRIDHLLLSPQAADTLRGVTILKEFRAREKPSDHVPVMADLG